MEGIHGAVLHTGDFRCEPVFINSLRKNPFLQRYIPQPDPARSDAYIKPSEALDTIFIDTENLLANYRVLPKVSQLHGNKDGELSETLNNRSKLRLA